MDTTSQETPERSPGPVQGQTDPSVRRPRERRWYERRRPLPSIPTNHEEERAMCGRMAQNVKLTTIIEKYRIVAEQAAARDRPDGGIRRASSLVGGGPRTIAER